MNRIGTSLQTLLLTTACLLSLSACDRLIRWFGNEPERLAQIDKRILYRQDVEGLVPPNLSSFDSANVINHYIDTWAIDYLLLKKAEANLSKEEKDVDQELADYRQSLLVFRYQKKYMESRIDTVITPQEIEQYYNDHLALFILDKPLCKARFIKMGLHSPYLPMVSNLYRTQSQEDLIQLDRLCESSAEVYTQFDNAWIGAPELAQDLPLTNDAITESLAPDGYISAKDSLYAYLVCITQFIPVGDPAPLETKIANIRQNIVSKRKQSLLEQLEADVLKEGWDTQQIKIYKKDED